MAPRKKKLTGAEKLKGVKIGKADASELENDDEVTAALRNTAVHLTKVNSEEDVEREVEESMALLEQGQEKLHPIGNGITVPLPYDGQEDPGLSSCSKPITGVNRGCLHHKYCPLPALALKYGQPGGGPYNTQYKNLRTGRIKTCFCVTAMAAYLKLPYIVFLPLDWVPTMNAERGKLKGGKAGPGQRQRLTRIEHTPRKTSVICTLPREAVNEFQKMRVSGAFEREVRARPRLNRVGA